MKTYDKIEQVKERIIDVELLKIAKTKNKYFTRERKIKFSDILFFTLNKRGLSLKMEMNNFEEIVGKFGEVSESALCQQRKKIDPVAFKILNKEYIQNSYENERDYKTLKGYIVTAIDGTILELPNVESLKKEYGVAQGKEEQRISVRAQGSCLYDVVNNWVIDAQISKSNTSERELAKIHVKKLNEILEEIGKKEIIEKIIIIFDRGYPSIEMIYMLEQIGIKYLFRAKKLSLAKEFEKMNSEDEEIKIELTSKRISGINDSKIRNQLREIQSLKSRFVKYELNTGETELLITNLDKSEFNTQELGELYYERWKIELSYNVAKNKLELENFSGQSKLVVEQEFYAQMLMMNIAEDLRKEANQKVKAGKEQGCKYDYKVNMNVLIGLMRKKFVYILIQMALNHDKKAAKEYDEMIELMSKSLVPIRPNRSNDRNRYKGYNKYKTNMRRNS